MKHYFIFQVVAVLFLLSCSKDDITDPTIIKKESLSGVVQKGPFISGTGISIHELTGDLSQTGKNYTTQITDNKGSFQINNIELISNYISLRVDGFY